MILTEKVYIKRAGNKNLKYYSDLGYDTTLEIMEVDIKHLSSSSKYLVEVSCDFCEKVVERPYYLYLKNIKSNNLFSCSPKCGKNKTIMTNRKKLGVDYATQSDLIKEKTKKTNIEKWGFESPSQNEEIKEKIKKTNIEKWGVESTLSSEIVREKAKKTMMNKWGVNHNFKVSEILDKRKSTYFEKWGVDNPSKSEEIKEKKRITSLKNWGVDNPSKSDEIKDKKRITSLKNWGTDEVLSSEKVREKIKNTILSKWGVDHNMKAQEVLENLKSSNLEKWGVEWTLQSQEIREKIILTNLEKRNVDHALKDDNFRKINLDICKDSQYIEYKGDKISIFSCNLGHKFEISSSNYHSRKKMKINLCTICNPIGQSSSLKEKELAEFISNIYDKEIIKSYRDEFEIDIYLPELKLGFEFNGLYWHSEEHKDKNYHLLKTNHFRQRGIKLLHIWEDDWTNKKEIVKSIVRNSIGLSTKIFARKCEIREIQDSKETRDFLTENHLLSHSPSIKKSIGLFYENELLSIMTLDKFEGRKKLPDVEWNLSRFCNRKDHTVIGGASRLLNYFIKKYSPKRIISYADKDWSTGHLYEKLGFNKIYETNPDYKYVVDNIRRHKSGYKKSNLNIGSELTEAEFMKKSHILRIWDCGKIKYEKLF